MDTSHQLGSPLAYARTPISVSIVVASAAFVVSTVLTGAALSFFTSYGEAMTAQVRPIAATTVVTASQVATPAADWT